MKIENYEAVLAVCQYGGWTEAAYQTIQSPSTISKRVNKVEEELGAPIFLRGRDSHAALTEFGELMVPYIQRIAALNHRVLAYAGSVRNKNGAELTVGYPPLMGTVGEAEILSRFKNENPSVRVSHVLRHRKEDLLFMLQEGRLDCAFVFMVGDERVHSDVLDVLLSNGICHIPIMRRDFVSVGLSERHPLAGRDAVSISELYQDTFVFSDTPTHENLAQGALRFFFGEKAAWHVPVKIARMDFINKPMVASFVSGNRGVLPTACIPPDSLPGVQFLPVADCSMAASAIFAYPKHYSSPTVKALVPFVREYAAEQGVLQ